jgi:AraC-like DNA-binding protein
MDVLSDVLRVVRLSGAVFFTADFSSPWAVESKRELLAAIVKPEVECVVLFHILIEGECLIECAPLPAVKMETGDVIIFPHGHRHTMRSHPGASTTPIDSVLSQGTRDELPQVCFGGGGRESRFVCGYLLCDQRFNPLVGALPTMLLVRSRDDYAGIEAIDDHGKRPTTTVPRGTGTWLGTTLKFTINEARTGRPGNGAMLGRLTELMFVEVLREYMQQVPAERGGWLAGLNDPQVGKALRLLHAEPMRNWTVEELARETAMSRSALAERFTVLVGEAPMRYLANWRMQLARQLLREGSHSMQEVASRVGYESEAAFNRAFKRATGSPPASWRKAQ